MDWRRIGRKNVGIESSAAKCGGSGRWRTHDQERAFTYTAAGTEVQHASLLADTANTRQRANLLCMLREFPHLTHRIRVFDGLLPRRPRYPIVVLAMGLFDNDLFKTEQLFSGRFYMMTLTEK